MYSPKIREDLIPRIYRAAKAARVAMTKWVNQVLERALAQPESPASEPSERQEEQEL